MKQSDWSFFLHLFPFVIKRIRYPERCDRQIFCGSSIESVIVFRKNVFFEAENNKASIAPLEGTWECIQNAKYNDCIQQPPQKEHINILKAGLMCRDRKMPITCRETVINSNTAAYACMRLLTGASTQTCTQGTHWLALMKRPAFNWSERSPVSCLYYFALEQQKYWYNLTVSMSRKGIWTLLEITVTRLKKTKATWILLLCSMKCAVCRSFQWL